MLREGGGLVPSLPSLPFFGTVPERSPSSAALLVLYPDQLARPTSSHKPPGRPGTPGSQEGLHPMSGPPPPEGGRIRMYLCDHVSM